MANQQTTTAGERTHSYIDTIAIDGGRKFQVKKVIQYSDPHGEVVIDGYPADGNTDECVGEAFYGVYVGDYGDFEHVCDRTTLTDAYDTLSKLVGFTVRPKGENFEKPDPAGAFAAAVSLF